MTRYESAEQIGLSVEGRSWIKLLSVHSYVVLGARSGEALRASKMVRKQPGDGDITLRNISGPGYSKPRFKFQSASL